MAPSGSFLLDFQVFSHTEDPGDTGRRGPGCPLTRVWLGRAGAWRWRSDAPVHGPGLGPVAAGLGAAGVVRWRTLVRLFQELLSSLLILLNAGPAPFPSGDERGEPDLQETLGPQDPEDGPLGPQCASQQNKAGGGLPAASDGRAWSPVT